MSFEALLFSSINESMFASKVIFTSSKAASTYDTLPVNRHVKNSPTHKMQLATRISTKTTNEQPAAVLRPNGLLCIEFEKLQFWRASPGASQFWEYREWFLRNYISRSASTTAIYSLGLPLSSKLLTWLGWRCRSVSSRISLKHLWNHFRTLCVTLPIQKILKTATTNGDHNKFSVWE